MRPCHRFSWLRWTLTRRLGQYLSERQTRSPRVGADVEFYAGVSDGHRLRLAVQKRPDNAGEKTTKVSAMRRGEGGRSPETG